MISRELNKQANKQKIVLHHRSWSPVQHNICNYLSLRWEDEKKNSNLQVIYWQFSTYFYCDYFHLDEKEINTIYEVNYWVYFKVKKRFEGNFI